ncbi:MAG TPA: aminotransferase class V-fold PLP-dependent enzyme [Gammaproteobacteria bacterium]|nr:aminotransferase class V-fold PLP-dependent enzyme [Gammaproteobacteria bacterium]
MIDDEFPLDDELCYLNHAAVSPWPQRTVAAVRRFAEENGRQGSRHYSRWLATESALRAQLCRLVNASHSDEIALLKNTSEALSVVAFGLDWHVGDEVVISNQEFPSNRIVWEALAPLGVRLVTVDIDDMQSAEQRIVDAIGPRTRLVSLSSVQYGSGLALPLEPVGRACRERGVLLCIDAIQGLGVRPFDAQACHADFVMADGHKWMLGPEGLALFYCRRERLEQLRLHEYGWHMVEALGDFERRDWQPARSARRFECGSPNLLGIHALHASLGLLEQVGVANIFETVSRKVQYLIDKLVEHGATILSAKDPARRAGIVTFRLEDADMEALYQRLQANGVVCALRAGGIRFSPHFYTPDHVLDRALEQVFAHRH